MRKHIIMYIEVSSHIVTTTLCMECRYVYFVFPEIDKITFLVMYVAVQFLILLRIYLNKLRPVSLQVEVIHTFDEDVDQVLTM